MKNVQRVYQMPEGFPGGGPRKARKMRQNQDALNEIAECTLTCFKLAFHKLRLGSLPTVKEPALALTPKNQSRGTPGWGWVCCACPQKRHIHRHLLPCNGKITSGLFHITAQNHQKRVPERLLFRAEELFYA